MRFSLPQLKTITRRHTFKRRKTNSLNSITNIRNPLPSVIADPFPFTILIFTRAFYYLHYPDKSVDFQEKEIISLMSHGKQEVAAAALWPSLPHSEPSGSRHRPLRRKAVELVQTEVPASTGLTPLTSHGPFWTWNQTCAHFQKT